MSEPMVGSLIYGDHKVPKKRRPWQQQLKIIGLVVAAFLLAGALTYKFYNYREENSVKEFLADVSSGQLDAAFAKWDIEEGGSYTRKDFENDWGKEGYYTKGSKPLRVVDSNSKNAFVIVYIDIETEPAPLALIVDKQTLKLSSLPPSVGNKYKVRQK